jgi:hypothetical protein
MTYPNETPGNTGTFAGAPAQGTNSGTFAGAPAQGNNAGTFVPPPTQNYPGGQLTAQPLATATPAPVRYGRSRETKTALLTTEFWAYLGAVIAVVATCLYFNSDNGGEDEFTADQALRYVTWLTIGYMVARGLAKAGRRHFGDPEDR